MIPLLKKSEKDDVLPRRKLLALSYKDLPIFSYSLVPLHFVVVTINNNSSASASIFLLRLPWRVRQHPEK